MYKEFTDRARKITQLANEEAHRLYRGYLGTEHLLLGLIRVGSGVAVTVLNNLHVDLNQVRIEVEKGLAPGPARSDRSR